MSVGVPTPATHHLGERRAANGATDVEPGVVNVGRRTGQLG
jgi:hypothetical protein